MKYAIVKNNEIIKILNDNQPFEYNGINYPANWLQCATDEEKQQLNIFSIIENSRPSDLFYTNINDEIIINGDGNPELIWHATEKDINEIKNFLLQIVKNKAYRALQQTDWYIVRFIETGTPIPEDVQQQRTMIRENTIQKETQINNANSVQELIELEIV